MSNIFWGDVSVDFKLEFPPNFLAKLMALTLFLMAKTNILWMDEL